MTSEQDGMPRVLVGVDVGGTNTDAVLLQTNTEKPTILSFAKANTTSDVTSGVISAVKGAISKALADHPSGLGITQINIGTTHFINAVVERKGLTKVCFIRLCGPASRKAPPFCDFPKDLADCVNGLVCLVDGGYEVDGREISAVNENEVIKCIDQAKNLGINNFVVSGIFSPLRTEQEDCVFEIISKYFPESTVTLSNKIGHIGLIERENASILNESLKPLCKQTLTGFKNAFRSMNLKCPFYLTQNDGTIVNYEHAIEFPVFTFVSGPTNSMRGSAFLSGLSDAIIVDIGGTTTDIGLLRKGFPREASAEVRIGGVLTSFQLPDVISFGLGGGSYVAREADNVMIGPLSCGFKLKDEALIFKENIVETDIKQTVTATDIAVAAGFCQLGNPENVKHLSPNFVSSATTKIREMLESKIDQVKLDNSNLPVVVVGGGNILLDSSVALKGSTKVLKPEFSNVANAVGAALSQISGSVDYVTSLFDKLDENKMTYEIETAIKNLDSNCSLDEKESVTSSIRKSYLEKARDVTISEACKFATELAVKSGANLPTVYVMEKSDTPLSYLPGNATRVKVKVIGDLNHNREVFVIREISENSDQQSEEAKAFCQIHKQEMTVFGQPLAKTHHNKETLCNYQPYINEKGEWVLSVLDINCIAIGAGILGCGGGGSPYLGRLLAIRAIESGRKIRVITPDKIIENADDENDIIMQMGFMGAPLVVQEKLVSGRELPNALECMRDIYVHGKYKDGQMENIEGVEVKEKDGVTFVDNYNPKITHTDECKSGGIKNIIGIISAEIGGLNAIEPLLVSADLDIPTVDCDGMGRAFPELQMICPIIYGLDPFPSSLADEKGRRAVVLKCPSPKHLESHFRRVVVEMGCSGGVVISVLKKADLASKTIHYSVSRAWRLGKAVLMARENNESPVEAIITHEGGKMLITGKIIDVLRETTGGFNKGRLKVEGIDQFMDKNIDIEFQNENLLARNSGTDFNGEVLACTPELITVVDSDTGEPISTENVKYGMRISVLVLPIADIMMTEQALKFVGPQAFGYPPDVVFSPSTTYTKQAPVGPR